MTRTLICVHGAVAWRCPKCSVDESENREREITAAVAAEREKWRGAVTEIIATLPKCFRCEAVATRVRGAPGAVHWCDKHDASMPSQNDGALRELPYTPALRKLLSMLETP